MPKAHSPPTYGSCPRIRAEDIRTGAPHDHSAILWLWNALGYFFNGPRCLMKCLGEHKPTCMSLPLHLFNALLIFLLVEWETQAPGACLDVGGNKGVHVWIWQLCNSFSGQANDNQGKLQGGLHFFLKLHLFFFENLENAHTNRTKKPYQKELVCITWWGEKWGSLFWFQDKKWLDQSLSWQSRTTTESSWGE